MRRFLSSVLVAFGCAAAGLTGASAAPAAGHAAPTGAGPAMAKPGKKACTVTDQRLDELSGIVARKKGYVVINDGSDQPGRNQIFFLDAKCQVTEVVPYSGNGPRDTEDLGRSPDGKTLWIADIGDNISNEQRRDSVALWSMPEDGSKKPVVHRAVYPDGPHDAEALLINGDGTPIIVTKEAGKSRLYVPVGKLKPKSEQGVPLRLAGEVKIPASTTSNPFSIAGRLAITGGAVAPAGDRVVLRTYADAFEWDVTNGDVLAALKTPPRITPLPDEPFGEAVTYSSDGKTLLTVSDFGDVEEDRPINIVQYVPAATVPKAAPAGGAAKPAPNKPSWFDQLSLQDLTYLIGAVGILGALLVAAGVFGIFRSRRRPTAIPVAKKPTDKKTDGAPSGPPPGADPDAETALLAPVREPVAPVVEPGDRRAGGVYGAGSGVYGGRPAPDPAAPTAGVYGGQSARVYGGGGQPRTGVERDVQHGSSAWAGARNGHAPRGGAGVYGHAPGAPGGGYPEGPGQPPRTGR